MLEFDHQTSRHVDQVMGAFFVVRKEVFDALGGFDEQFFVYFEDVDFSLRARCAGWSTYYLADATAFHKGEGTSAQAKANRLFYSLRSRILYAFKHFTRSQAWLVAGLTILVEPIVRLIRAMFRLSARDIASTLRGWGMLLLDLRHILGRASRQP